MQRWQKIKQDFIRELATGGSDVDAGTKNESQNRFRPQYITKSNPVVL